MKYSLKILLLLGIMGYSFPIFSQNLSNGPYSFEEIPIQRFQNDTTYIYFHSIRKGETLFRLARLFGVKTADIYEFNPHLENTIISIGETVNIPIRKNFYKRNKEELIHPEKAIPIVYTAKPKENLFRIARIYFDQQISDLAERNSLESFTISIGQKLIIGWIEATTKELDIPASLATPEQKLVFEKIIQKSKDQLKDQKNENTSHSVVVEIEPEEAKIIEEAHKNNVENAIPESNTEMISEDMGPFLEETIKENSTPIANAKEEKEIKEEVIEDPKEEVIEVESVPAKPVYVVRTEKGLAVWKRNSADTENLYALHPTAKVNTMIEITNPMLNRKVLAKVIGNLPPRTYPESVKLVVTPRVAKDLGVMDSRFFVELRYLE